MKSDKRYINMATIAMQRDLILALKKETCLNIGILSKLQPMPSELSRQIFKENALEKPTQSLFNHLSHYLVSIIDIQVSASLPWPLYDTKTERAYRNEVSNFICNYAGKGLLAPVMSSYLVNPGCYKVTMLIFQLSQLAVQRILKSKMNKDHQKKIYSDMTEKYKANNKEGFLEEIEKETKVMLSKFSNYLHKRDAMEKIAKMFCCKITEMEGKLNSSNAKIYINDIVDGFISKYPLDADVKAEVLKIKNVSESSKIFERWLSNLDEQIDVIENTWDRKMQPFLRTCQDTQKSTKAVISIHMGEVDKNSYMIEYNPKTDEICTRELQNQVNSQQKYILKNIVKNERLNFPNLIRAFLIAICFVLKNTEIGDDIYQFNEYLENAHISFGEIVLAIKTLIERVANLDSGLQHSPLSFNHSYKPVKDLVDLPSIPDLTDLKSNRNLQNQVLFDSFTPMNTYKHQFNLLRKKNSSFTKPQPRSILVTPFHHGPRDDFLKSIISCRISSYDRPNTSQNFHSMSMMSHANKANETIAECSTGFTKQQILRLLSTKKTSSSKKFKYSTDRPEINVKKGGLFNESNTSSESNCLFRSYSSPNLFENRDKRSLSRGRRRKLSIMQEDSPSMLEVSGIAALEKDSSYGTPQDVGNFRKIIDTTSLPTISITPDPEQKLHGMLKDIEYDFNKHIDVIKPVVGSFDKEEAKTETPKNNTQLIRKTSSLEKIINRFKKVRANIVQTEENVATNEFKTIVEEKENLNMVNVEVFTANRILLPDLLSPSCSGLSRKSNTDYVDQICFEMDEKVRKKPRESLGAALGVDHTFLDQFDLID